MSTITNEIPQFRETLKDLREKMLKMLKMCEGRDFKQSEALEILNDSLINLIDTKSLNRQIQGEVESIKDFLKDEKEKVEEKNLQLQNNMYQKENIVSQINSCINFPTVEMNKIQMPSKSEVLEFQKEKKHSHQQQISEEEMKLMDYLECELHLREKLNEKVNESLTEKEKNITKLKDFEKFYSDLPKYLESLENSTLKSQTYLNLNLNERNKNVNLSGKLPPPLFILYNLLLCLGDEAFESEVNIKGQDSRVEDFYSKYSCFFETFFASKSFPSGGSSAENANEDYDDAEALVGKQKEEGEHSEGEIEDEETLERKNLNKKKQKKQKKSFFNNSLKNNFNTNNYNINSKDANYNNVDNNNNFNNSFNALSEEQAEFKKFVYKLANREEKLEKFPLFVEFVVKKCKEELNTENDEVSGLYPTCFRFYFIPVVNLVSVEIIVNKALKQQQSNLNSKVINLLANEDNSIENNLNTNQVLFNIFNPPFTLLTVIKNKVENILGECCADFGKSEKLFDFMQILSNNSLHNSKSLKDFCKLYLNYKNIKNKFLLLSISTENSLLENSQNIFEQEASQINLNSSSIENTNTINIDNFISRIKERLVYLPLLLSQVDYLLKFFSLKEEILVELRSQKKFQIVKEKTKITNVRKISKLEFYLKQEEILNLSNEAFKISEVFNSENSEKIYEKTNNYCNVKNNFDVEAVYLCIEFERKNYKISAFVEIRYDFPNFAPRFILAMENTKNNSSVIPEELMQFVNKDNNLDDFQNENCGFSSLLREIENEVNEYCLEDLNKNEKIIELLFSYQIRTIQMCIDVFVDKENSKYNAYFALENTSNKRNRPFLFVDINSSAYN